MMSTPKPPHDLDLERRYQELDYVAAFQKYWAIFNRWFKGETGETHDRAALRSLSTNGRWKTAVEAASPTLDPVVEDTNDADADYYRFTTGGLIASFVEALWDCPDALVRINLFNTNTVDRVRGTATIVLTNRQYRRVHRHHMRVLARPHNMPRNETRIGAVLAHRHVDHVGSAFFRASTTPSPVTGPDAAFFGEVWAEIDADTDLSELSGLSQSTIAPGLPADLLEMLYIVRNGCVHGDYDFLQTEHNRLSREALGLLESVLRSLR